MQFDIRRLDIYRKIPKDLTQPTYTGASISICSVLFIVYLFLAELHDFLSLKIKSELIVDDPVSHASRIPVSIDISLPHLHCDFIGLDIQDDLGRHEVGFVGNTEKYPLNDGAGCHFKGDFLINKVHGNFHISTHSSRKKPEKPNMFHTINKVSFGDANEHFSNKLIGSFNPLGNVSQLEPEAKAELTHDYFIKIVPAVYTDLNEKQTYPYQYTYAHRSNIHYGHNRQVSPAIWFKYDITPISVKYTEEKEPLYSFLTSVCAIVGGSFTVAGILDSLFFTAYEVFRKAEIGKLS